MLVVLLIFFYPVFFTGCASPTKIPIDTSAYLVQPPASIKKLHTPAFLIRKGEEKYNRIGMPAVRQTADRKTEIYVNPNKPAIFYETMEFSTNRARYRNLIYRVHFEKVPFGFGNFNFTTGNNPGILIIYTLNEEGKLILVTTLHTCGCFLTFFPTDEMDRELYPADWPEESQGSYGKTLPGHLEISPRHFSDQIVFTLESATHRIVDVTLSTDDFMKNSIETIAMDKLPMSKLYHLPFKDSTESFFEMDGPRNGYVRNNTKILERLLISWWAFDFHVGEDKAYGADDRSEAILYTSLKFWARKASDLKDFPRFLSYWGWKL
jgi:hypothetical protein